jgi:beta-N-acetylhexosaminidase/D-alanyl-D-alanine dipeptidase
MAGTGILVIVAAIVASGCATPARTTPAPGSSPGAYDLVDIATVDGTIVVDIRYATPHNFTGIAVYPVARCLLRRDVAERLARVQQTLRAETLGLKVWDCYRPFSVQQRFWQLVPDERYVARPVVDAAGMPVEGSKHNRGAAVDVTLVDHVGRELKMPTGYDDFSESAHRDVKARSATAQHNSEHLESVMVAEGFEPLPTEWWHFDGPGWERYPLSDVPLR